MTSFKGFETKPHLAVAVSGGSDSMALALLAKQWVLRNSGQLTALIVDHGLRSESTREAEFVQKKLHDLGIGAQILSWQGVKPTTRVQERAREKRYELLEEWCCRHGILHLLVAHHGDDQWETVLYRLSKGSDLPGLLGMQPVVSRSFGRILRPLLGFSKADLKATLQVYGGEHVEDPSNDNDRFTRVKWRNLYGSLSALELDRERILRSIDAWRGTLQIYHKTLHRFLSQACVMDEYGCFYLCLDRFQEEDREFQRRVLQKILSVMGKKFYGVELKTVDHVITRLFDHHQQAATGAGCYILKRQKELLIMREERAISLPQMITTRYMWWDDRFLLELPKSYFGMEVRALGKVLAQKWCKELSVHSQILQTLPALYHQGKCMGLVHLMAQSHPDIKVCCFLRRCLLD